MQASRAMLSLCEQKVVGAQMIGPAAPKILQSLAVAIKALLTKVLLTT